MNFDALKSALTLDNQGTLTIEKGQFTPNIDTLIAQCYFNIYNNNQTGIAIHNAAITVNNGSIDVSGSATFLKTNITATGANLNVSGTFRVDDSGDVQLLLRYALLSDAPGPNDWKFSDTFADMPVVTDYDKPVNESSILFLDEFYLYGAGFVVSSQALTADENTWNVPLIAGINFVSDLKPQGILGIIESTFNQAQPLVVSGPIYLPQISEVIPPREPFVFPWQNTGVESLPGIHLKVKLADLDIGNNAFKDVYLQIYTPVSQDWLTANASQTPLICFTGGFNFSSDQDVSMDLVAEYQPGAQDLYLVGVGHGLSIKNLAEMAHLTGGDDSSSALPDTLEPLVSALSAIELQSIGLGLSLGSFPPSINYAMFSIGLSDVDWQIWEGHFAITDLGCRFEVFNPFDRITRQMEVTLIAKTELEGHELDIYASSRDRFTFYANLENATIPLSSMMSNLGVDLPKPSDLTIDSLRVGIAPGRSYSLALFMARTPNTWKIDLGPKTLAISDVTASVSYPKGGPVAGSFGGTLSIDDIGSFTCHYSLTGELMAYSYIPTISLDGLIDALSLVLPPLPADFHLELTDSYAMIQHSSALNNFILTTDINDYGTLAFQAGKSADTGGAWGFALGFNLGSGSLTAINGLAPLEPLTSLFELQELVLVVSSFTSTAFSFPGLEHFNSPSIASKGVSLPAQSSGVIQGLNLYGQWQINTHDQKQQFLKEFLGLDPSIGITVQVGANPAKDASVYASYNGHIMNMPLQARFGARIQDAVPEFFLSGSLQTSIQGSTQLFTVTMVFNPNGAFASGSMQGPKPIDFEVFKLGNLALEIGCSYEGIPSLGIAGTIIVDNFMSSVAVFFDSAVPTQSMVAGAVSDLHLGDVLDTLTGDVIPSDIDAVLNQVAIEGTKTFTIAGSVHDDLVARNYGNIAKAFAAAGVIIPSSSAQLLVGEGKDDNTWFITDLANNMMHYQLTMQGDTCHVVVNAQFYCAPQGTSIGNLRFNQGFFISGQVRFFGLKASATITINPNKGLAVDAQMSKIVLGNENLLSIKAAEGDGGPVVSIATFSQPELPEPEFRLPHFYVNGELTLLGMTRSVYVDVSTKGAKFDLKGDLLPGGLLRGELEGEFDSATNANVKGDVSVGIGEVDLGPLGSFNIDTGATGALDIFVKGSDIGAWIQAGFELAGEKLSLPKLQIDVDTGDLAHLPKMLFDAVVDFLEALFKDPKEWAKYAKKALDWTEDKISGVLSDAFGLDKDQVKEVLDTLSYLCPVTAALHAF
ncbi:MAG: hypothetical protein OXE99_09965 [Cellvibrionales bacterium]|nr:hypothetical protein [Cellvibrionales bacterium]